MSDKDMLWWSKQSGTDPSEMQEATPEQLAKLNIERDDKGNITRVSVKDDFALAAKFFDADGTVMISRERLKLALGNPNGERVEAFASTVQCGNVFRGYSGTGAGPSLYVWNLVGRKKVVALLERLLPYLTGRRKEMALIALERKEP